MKHHCAKSYSFRTRIKKNTHRLPSPLVVHPGPPSQSEKRTCLEEMHLEDTIEFCATVKRESEQTSASKTRGKTRKGVFTAPSVNSLKGNLGSVYKEKLMRIFQFVHQTIFLQEPPCSCKWRWPRNSCVKTYLKLYCQAVRWG